jgi:hypothetical protein
MPIHSVVLPGGGTGFQWGRHGAKYADREGAERQAAAAHANGASDWLSAFDVEWNESDHPRDEQGKFASGGTHEHRMHELSAQQLRKEIDKARAKSSAIGSELINAGRGSEKYLETAAKAKEGDPLAKRYVAATNEEMALVGHEGERQRLGEKFVRQRGKREYEQKQRKAGVINPRVEPPSENVTTVLQSNFTNGVVYGKESVPIGKLNGGVRLDDPTEARRVKELAEKIAAPDGYIARILVDMDNNVVEGQHRLEALRSLGIKKVPILRVGEATHGLPTEAMEAAIKVTGPIHSDHVNQIMEQVGTMLREEKGDPDAVLREYQFPQKFVKFFEAALGAVKQARKPTGDTAFDWNTWDWK